MRGEVATGGLVCMPDTSRHVGKSSCAHTWPHIGMHIGIHIGICRHTCRHTSRHTSRHTYRHTCGAMALASVGQCREVGEGVGAGGCWYAGAGAGQM